jgi:formiminotetrahydrofolate cyclodeaminase
MGAALGAMVWRLTQAKGSSDLSEERLHDLIGDFDRLRVSLTAAFDRDAASYEGVLAAMRLPKQSDEERAGRVAAIEVAMRTATEVPLETARLCGEVLHRCAAAARLGLGQAVTDAGVGAQMAFAGLVGALYNVEINLSGLSDEVFRGTASAEAATLRLAAEEVVRAVDEQVAKRIGT